jgi:hypothetical protein
MSGFRRTTYNSTRLISEDEVSGLLQQNTTCIMLIGDMFGKKLTSDHLPQLGFGKGE